MLFASTAFGQKASFKVAINSNVLKTGDTLDIEAVYQLGDKKLPPATLDLIIENERGNTWNIRWPLIDGTTMACLVFSKFLPMGKYHLWFAVQPRVFRMYGKIVYCNRKKLRQLEAYAFVGNQDYKPQKINLEQDGSFTIKDWEFTSQMTLAFSTGNPDDVLHIHPESWLDSAYTPAAQSYAAIQLTNTDTAMISKTIPPALRPLAWRGNGVYHNLTPAEIYNHFFSTGLFRDTSEIVIDVMGDSTVTAATNILKYVEAQLLKNNIEVTIANNKLFFKGKELIFFYDELLYMPPFSLKNIAIIKLLAHHISTGGNGELNALAFYSKRYPYTEAGIAQKRFFD